MCLGVSRAQTCHSDATNCMSYTSVGIVVAIALSRTHEVSRVVLRLSHPHFKTPHHDAAGFSLTLLVHAALAAESGKVDEDKFIENTLKEMSVALCRGNGSILAAGQKVLAQVTGHDVQPKLPCPRAELI